MRRNLLSFVVTMLMGALIQPLAAQTFTYPVKGAQGLSLTQENRNGVSLQYDLHQFSFEPVSYKGEDMAEITINGITLPNDAGCPNLPSESRIVAIPQGATARLTVTGYDSETIHNVNIAPARAIQSEDDEPIMDYVKDAAVYGVNAGFPKNPFQLSETTSLRGVDAVVVSVTPFQYNPVTKDLTVYSHVELELSFEGGKGEFSDSRLRSPYWDAILASELANYDQLPTIDYAARLQQWNRDGANGAEYLIITPNNNAWAPFAKQLKDYRTRQGIITKVYRLDEMNVSTPDQMKAWFHNAYNTWDIAPVAVCLMADYSTDVTQGIPAEIVEHFGSHTCISDNPYADVNGDLLPDMTFSRIVASNTEELATIVSKQINYETHPCMDEDFYKHPTTALGWQTERWFQLCSEVIGGYFRKQGKETVRINAIYQGLPGSQWSTAENTSSVVSYFGPTGTGYIPATPSELGNWTNGEPEDIVRSLNTGSFLLQHRDHGFEDGWGEPAFRNNHVDMLTNVGKLPFVFSINCLTGKFNHEPRCFAEAFLRHTYDGEPAGAVGLLCPTEVSYSYVNDCYVWGAFDLFDPGFMPTYGPYASYSGNWFPAFGNVAGKHFLFQTSWPSIPTYKDITYQMFTAHCDAFLRLFTEVPQEMNVNYPQVIFTNTNQIRLTVPNGCFISIVKADGENWNIIATAQGTGNPIDIAIPQQTAGAELDLIITGQNFLRFEETIRVVPSGTPYIVYDANSLHDANGNGMLESGEDANFDITLRNIGSQAMNAFSATLTSDSPYIDIVNAVAQYNGLASNQTQNVNDAFAIRVADNIPDNTDITFTISIANGNETYTSKFRIKAFAPILKVTGMVATELNGNGNGRLDAGETALVSYTFKNIGHSAAQQTVATLSSPDPLVSVVNSVVDHETIAAGASETGSFTVNISEDITGSFLCPVSLHIAAGEYQADREHILKIALQVEDFENGYLGTGWQSPSPFPWMISTVEPYQGNYCMQSSTIPNQQHSDLIFTHEAQCDDTISFYFRVSTEVDFDLLHFYIDEEEKGTWSGIWDWRLASFPVTEGLHTYKWSYTKDFSHSGGEDRVWIDLVTLPFHGEIADIVEAELNTSISVFPNPTQGNLTIREEGLTRVTVFNSLGQSVLDSAITGDECRLDLSQYGAGLYLLRIATTKGICTQPVNVVK